MTTFLYLGGKEFDGTDLPASTTMFGIKFIEEVPKAVEPGSFKSQREYDHAIAKLSTHAHFKKLDDSVQEVIEAPKKTWSRRPKAKAEVEATDVPEADIQDAAE